MYYYRNIPVISINKFYSLENKDCDILSLLNLEWEYTIHTISESKCILAVSYIKYYRMKFYKSIRLI